MINLVPIVKRMNDQLIMRYFVGSHLDKSAELIIQFNQ